MRVARAEAARWLQRMLEAHGVVSPVQHDRGPRQRLALQPPHPGMPYSELRRSPASSNTVDFAPTAITHLNIIRSDMTQKHGEFG
jgi:hypothetical protein